ncbi:MFS transporter [Alicyclobacillus tolerans]|uniref:MFS transporter n=1 Tax=Alicyclobacillus tolerans TaxID=90970 RepID=UPI00351C5FD9
MQLSSHLEDLSDTRQPLWHQPLAVWSVAFACIIAFMGLGLVDPILPDIASKLHASPAEVELLFTSYNLVMALAMVITSGISSRIGYKGTLIAGLLLIILFSALAGHAANVGQIVWFRAGWGLGNALFISTALAVIVSVANGGPAGAIILYEAALGLGISVGPLLGGELGAISWRGPFYGVAVLMCIGFLLTLILLKGNQRPVARHSLIEPFFALRHRGLLTMGLTAFFYNFGFFTLLAYTPFVLRLSIHQLGYVFFGWGICLAITSVWIAPHLQKKFGTSSVMMTVLTLFALDLIIMAVFTNTTMIVSIAVILAGALLGINNTLITTAVMVVSPFERPIASSAYSFVRFLGGAIAPWLAGKLASWYNPHIPFYSGALGVILSVVILAIGRKHLASIPRGH